MTAETENLMLDLIRGLRADADGLRRDIAAAERDLWLEGDERCEGVETRLEGIRYGLVASVGAIATGPKDHETRIAALEGVRA